MKTPIRALTALSLCLVLLVACGRTASRIGGKAQRQVLEVPGEFISISFDKRGDSTVKDVTFLAADGFVYTQEFKDVSPLEGAIRWVPHGTGSDIIQSRRFSRWTGGAVNLELPEDCEEILGVDVGYSSKSERVKNVTYRSSDGAIYSREYREGFIDRNFEGWLEIRRKE
ncbi:MAG: hypothetical protein AAF560_06840 [Acidobacteriota bacterium]